jgi:C1A family cysteine protease
MAEPTPRKIARYGWRPDAPDQRDYRFEPPADVLAALPSMVDLRPSCPPVYDQGQLGSCTANAIGGAVEFERRRQQLLPDFVPSRLFIYYGEREIEGTVDSDAGAEIRDGMKVVATAGAPPESDWPYDINRFADKPPAKAFDDALTDVTTQYQRLSQTLAQMKGCLASGLPFVFGFSVYESFESNEVASTGVVPMPGPDEAVIGGHAVCAAGYDDGQQRFICRNSWGSDWGMAGYFTMPYAYLEDPQLASDFWVVQMVSGTPGPGPAPTPPVPPTPPTPPESALVVWFEQQLEHLPQPLRSWLSTWFEDHGF